MYTEVWPDCLKHARTHKIVISCKEVRNADERSMSDARARACLCVWRRVWARRMCERVRDPRWIHAQFSRDVADDVISRDVNIFFIKLHLLDPAAVLPAFNALTKGTVGTNRHAT